ncbi:YeeZ-like protein [Drosera capensis]
MGSCVDMTPCRPPSISAGFRQHSKPPPISLAAYQFYRVSAHSDPSIESQSGSGRRNLGNDNRMFIWGMGYVGQFFAQQLKQDGWVVTGTCKSIAKKKELEKMGFSVNLFDAYDPEWESFQNPRNCTHLLVCVPPLLPVGDQILQLEEFLKSSLMGGELRWLCYLSSTSVYGDSKGAWVDEDSPPNPTSRSAELRLDAEEGWLRLGADLGLSTRVLRLGGIYGPGRSAIDTILKHEPFTESKKRRMSKTYTSRVHVADICQVLKASIFAPISRSIYNVVDDDPTSRAEVFTFAQELIEKRWPGLVLQIDHPVTSDVAEEKSIPTDEKRVSNALIKKELGIRLLYPSYRSGLQAILDQIESPSGYKL